MSIEINKSYDIIVHNEKIKATVLGIVDNVMVVYKYWVEERRKWVYKVERGNYFCTNLNILVKTWNRARGIL